MTYEEALHLLPPAYAQALQLQRQGWDEQRIAHALVVEVAAVGPLLRLAEAKLARLLDMSQDAEHAETGGAAASDNGL